MPEVAWWFGWMAIELVVVLVVLLVAVWWRGAATVARLASGVSSFAPAEPVPAAPPPPPRIEVPELADADVDAVDSGEAKELRSQLERAVHEMSDVSGAARELSTQISASLMQLLEKQGEVQRLTTLASAVAGLPEEAKTALGELTEVLRETDPLLGDACEQLDQIDASLEGLTSQLGRFSEDNGYEWARLRPTTEGLNRMLRLKVDPGGTSFESFSESTSEVPLPPGLGDAIDQAII